MYSYVKVFRRFSYLPSATLMIITITMIKRKIIILLIMIFLEILARIGKPA